MTTRHATRARAYAKGVAIDLVVHDVGFETSGIFEEVSLGRYGREPRWSDDDVGALAPFLPM